MSYITIFISNIILMLVVIVGFSLTLKANKFGVKYRLCFQNNTDNKLFGNIELLTDSKPWPIPFQLLLPMWYQEMNIKQLRHLGVNQKEETEGQEKSSNQGNS
jgi:hypothetical protein